MVDYVVLHIYAGILEAPEGLFVGLMPGSLTTSHRAEPARVEGALMMGIRSSGALQCR